MSGAQRGRDAPAHQGAQELVKVITKARSAVASDHVEELEAAAREEVEIVDQIETLLASQPDAAD